MSTRCYIGIENEDHTVEAVLCTKDGSPDTVGAILLKRYNNISNIKKLAALNCASEIKSFPSANAFHIDCAQDIMIDYHYLYQNGRWLYRDEDLLKNII